MKAIEKLITFIHSEERHTMIREGRKSLYLIKDDIGKAVVLYGQEIYAKDTLSLNQGLTAIAIFSDGICYLYDKYLFNWWGTNGEENLLPDGVIWFSAYVKLLNKELKYQVFPKFYQELVPTLPTPESKYWGDAELNIWGRQMLLDKMPFHSGLETESELDESDATQILCGFVEKETAFMSNISKAIDTYNIRKCKEMEIQQYIDTHKVVEDYEMSIINSIKNITAKTVTVYFEKDGKQASGKIAPDVIKRKCLHRDNFSSYDFNNRVEGQWALNTLNAASFRGIENNLYVKDITAITYRGKEIYRRKEI